MVEHLSIALKIILVPKHVFPLAFLGSLIYLWVYRYQGRFDKTNLSDFISTGFQLTSICGGLKLIFKVFLELSESKILLMEMDKFYTGYGGAAVIWISIVTLKKRLAKPV